MNAVVLLLDASCISVSRFWMNALNCALAVRLVGGDGDLYTELTSIFLLLLIISIVMHSNTFGMLMLLIIFAFSSLRT